MKIHLCLFFLLKNDYLSSMQIQFQTKEESKKKQEEAFLKLSPSERVIRFFQLSNYFLQFPQEKKKTTKNNFVLEKK